VDFQLNEEQQLLADSVRKMLDRSYDFESRKKIIASSDGSSAEAWARSPSSACSACRCPRTTAASAAERPT